MLRGRFLRFGCRGTFIFAADAGRLLFFAAGAILVVAVGSRDLTPAPNEKGALHPLQKKKCPRTRS